MSGILKAIREPAQGRRDAEEDPAAEEALLMAGLLRGDGIPQGPRAQTFIECGSCGSYHRTDYHGDCRNDAERFADIPAGGVEVFDDETS